MKSFFTQQVRNLANWPAPLRILSFLLILGLLWAPVAIPITWLIPNKNLVSLLTMPTLYLIFLAMLQGWGRWGHQEGNLFRRYGMRCPKAWVYEWLAGLGIGYSTVLLLFELQALLGWVDWSSPSRSMPVLLLEGCLIAALISLAEEIFFRGWLLDELQRSYAPNVALAVTTMIYAVSHSPRIALASVQWIALALLGWALGLAKRVTHDRLGLSAGLHGGLVWSYYVLNVGGLFAYTQRVPVWVTGLEQNPLAGVMGIMTMAGLAIGLTIVRQRQIQGRSSRA